MPHFWGVHPGGYDPQIRTQPRFLYTAPTPQVSSSYICSFGSYRYICSFGSYRVDKQTPVKTSSVLRYATTLGNYSWLWQESWLKWLAVSRSGLRLPNINWCWLATTELWMILMWRYSPTHCLSTWTDTSFWHSSYIVSQHTHWRRCSQFGSVHYYCYQCHSGLGLANSTCWAGFAHRHTHTQNQTEMHRISILSYTLCLKKNLPPLNSL